MRSIVALLAAVALMRCATAAHSELQRVPVTSTPAGAEVTLEPAPGRLIDVGQGRRLHIVCEGTGSPTVVLESGAGEGWYTWALVQPALARSYRTCSYDRAGIGFSDPRIGRSVSALND